MQRPLNGNSTMKTFNKSIFLAALVFLGGQAFAADQAAILGTWVATVESQGVSVELEIRNGSNGLEATIDTPMGKNSLQNFQFDGKEVSFRGREGTETLVFANDELAGDLTGQLGPMSLTFKKVQ
jgi:hypothetical protein